MSGGISIADAIHTPSLPRAVREEIHLHRLTEKIKRLHKLCQLEFIVPQDKQNNIVFALRSFHKLTNAPLGYLKFGRDWSEWVPRMERVMWQLFCELDRSHLCAPTVLMDVSITRDSEKFRCKAAFQPDAGTSFFQIYKSVKYSEKEEMPISFPLLCQAVLAAIFLGTFDAHGRNMALRKNGAAFEPVFFDNGRSLVEGNEAVEIDDGITYTPFTCDLLLLEDAAREFSREQRRFVLKELAHFRTCLPKVEAFLKKRQELWDTFPPYWINAEQAVTAMTERLSAMEMAMASNNPMTLRGLAHEAFPALGFCAGMSLLSKYNNERKKDNNILKIYRILQRTDWVELEYFGLRDQHNHNMRALIRDWSKIGVSPEYLYGSWRMWMGDKTEFFMSISRIYFAEANKQVFGMLDSDGSLSELTDNHEIFPGEERAKFSADRLIRHFSETAPIDNKDVSLKTIFRNAIVNIRKEFTDKNRIWVFLYKAERPAVETTHGAVMITIANGFQAWLRYREDGACRDVRFFTTSARDKFRVPEWGNQPFSTQQLAAVIKMN